MIIRTNLLPEELRKKERSRLSLPEVPIRKVALIFFGVFFTAQIFLSFFAFYERIQIRRVTQEAAQMKVQNHDLMLRKSETASMRVRSKEVDALCRREFFWTQILNDLSDSVTRGIWLTGFSISDGEEGSPRASGPASKRSKPAEAVKVLHLEGSAVGPGQETATIGKFIKELKENPSLNTVFQDIKLSDINQKKIREADVYDFVLICVFKQGKIK